jgi:hypothetical protein
MPSVHSPISSRKVLHIACLQAILLIRNASTAQQAVRIGPLQPVSFSNLRLLPSLSLTGRIRDEAFLL